MSVRETTNYFVQSKENLNTMSPLSMRMMDPLKIFSSMPNFNNNNGDENRSRNGPEESNTLMNLPFFQSLSGSNGKNIFQISSEEDQRTTPATQSSQTKGDDDFCSLCQKHFCNKYYLRKHKQDVHGIQSEPFSIARRRESSTNYSPSGVNKQPTKLSTDVVKEPVAAPQEGNEPKDALSLLKQGPLSLIPNFASILANFNAKANSGNKLPFLDSNITEILQNANNNDQMVMGCNETKSLKANNYPIGTNMDSFKSSMAAAKLADRVTCELCNKELCNKYFLRTHKFKVHGISQSDSSFNNCTNTSRENNNIQPQNQLSEPTTEAGENSPEVKQPIEETPEQEAQPKPDDSPMNTAQELLKSFMEEGDRKFNAKTQCPLCGVNVGNKFLLPGHLCQTHSLSITDPMFILCTLKANLAQPEEEMAKNPGENSEVPKIFKPDPESQPIQQIPPPQQQTPPPTPQPFIPANLMFPQNWGLNMFNPGQAPPLPTTLAQNDQSSPNFSQSPQQNHHQQHQLANSKSPNQMRVLCDICNKWICNKYFLRTHKANKHGIYDGMSKPPKKKLATSPSLHKTQENSKVQQNIQNNNSIQNLLVPFMGGFDMPNGMEGPIQHQNANNNNTEANSGDVKFNFNPSKISQLLFNNQNNKNNLSLDNLHIPLNLSLKELLPLTINQNIANPSALFKSPNKGPGEEASRKLHSSLSRRAIFKIRRRRPLFSLRPQSQRRATWLVQKSCFVLRRNRLQKTLLKRRQRRQQQKQIRKEQKTPTQQPTSQPEKVNNNNPQMAFQIPCIMCPSSKETYNLSTLIEHFHSVHSKPATDLPLDSLQGLFPNLMPNFMTAIGKQKPENLISSTSSSSSSSGLEFDSTLNFPNMGSLFNPFLMKMAQSQSKEAPFKLDEPNM